MRIQVAAPRYDDCEFSPSELSALWQHWGTPDSGVLLRGLSGLPSPVSRVGALRQLVTP